jgi:hypothetical protein
VPFRGAHRLETAKRLVFRLVANALHAVVLPDVPVMVGPAFGRPEPLSHGGVLVHRLPHGRAMFSQVPSKPRHG